MNRPPLLQRLQERDRAPVAFRFDGQPLQALAGDTVLTAVLTQGLQLRRSEFSGAPRAGFCLMGACQDCWVATTGGARLRACSTPIQDGMDLVTLNAPGQELQP
jgi:predicted molibdopterin-dependent oxidoreductase YjgC